MSSSYPPFGSGPAPSCQHCGQLLSPNEAQCRNCGYYNANGFRQSPSGPSWCNLSSKASFVATPVGGTPWAQVTAQPASNSPFASPFYTQPSSQTAMSNGYPLNSFAQTPPAPSPHHMGGLQSGSLNAYSPETFTQ